MRSVSVRRETWPIAGVFRISRGSRTEIQPIVVEIHENGVCGRGECVAYARYGSTVDSVVAEIEALIPSLERGLAREELSEHLQPGPARNAIDCALWDLAAKINRTPVWQLAGLSEPQPLVTAYTLSIDEPDAMAAAARKHADRPLLKLKLAGDGADLGRVAAVRDNAPVARIIVDANEAWSQSDYETLVPALVDLNVEMIEQPFKAAAEGLLAQLPRPIPVCADESCHDSDSLMRLRECYDMVNIKLHKTGGLSEALRLREAARELGFGIMVGCMLTTSLAIAPAMLVALGAQVVDLDGPLLLAKDREPGLQFEGSRIRPAPAELWG